MSSRESRAKLGKLVEDGVMTKEEFFDAVEDAFIALTMTRLDTAESGMIALKVEYGEDDLVIIAKRVSKEESAENESDPDLH